MKNDNLAAIGIGAMIVFIALILVAAVTPLSSFRQQRSSNRTHNPLVTTPLTKCQVRSKSSTSSLRTINSRSTSDSAAGSDDTADTDILFQIFCDDGAGGMDRISGDFGDSAIDPLSGAAAVTTSAAGVGYRTTVSVR